MSAVVDVKRKESVWDMHHVDVKGIEAVGRRVLRALILGSSNGFFRPGYVQAIADHPAFSETVNISLGASPAIMAPYRMKGVDLSSFDYLFVETLINDAASISNGTYWREALADVLGWIVHEATCANAIPVGLLLPGDFAHQSMEEVAEIHKSAFGGRVLDMLPILRRVAQPIGPLMHDASHVHPKFSYLATKLFLDHLTACKSPLVQQRSAARYLYILASGARRVDISTSVVSDVAYRYDGGQSFTIPVPSGRSVVALVFNQSNTRTVLKISGANTVLKDIRFDVDAPGGAKLIVSAMQPVIAGEQGVNFELTSLTGVERSYFVKPDRIEISGVIVREGEPLSAIGERSPTADIWRPTDSQIDHIRFEFNQSIQPV